MRRRLILGAVAVVTLAVLLFAVPLGILLRQQVVRSELDSFGARLEQTATFVDEQSRTCGDVARSLSALVGDGLDVVVFDRDGTARFVTSDAIATQQVERVPQVLSTATEGATGTALVDGDPVAAVPLSTRSCGEPLILQARTDGAATTARVRRALLLVVVAGLVAVLAASLVASALGSRLARPLERLAASARRLGEGDFSERAPRTGLPESDGIADALDLTADRLGRAVTRGSAFAADASHQLRTPLTALRLQLESAGTGLDRDDPRRDALDGALAEVDRLAATIDELVALTQAETADELVDVAALVRERTQDWARRASELDREVILRADRVPALCVRPAAVVQAVDVLLDNALRHGDGQVTVAVGATPPDGDDAIARIVVRDEGPGLPEDLDVLGDRSDRGALPVHGGRGLLLARDLVEGEGGRLVLDSTTGGTRAALLIPVVRPRGTTASASA